MKKDIERIIDIPEGVEVNLNDDEILIKGNGKEVKREFNLNKIKIEINKDKKTIIISSKKATKKEGKVLGSIVGHIKNMINGLNEDFVYKLEIANVHFPMNVKAEGNKITIKNFLGEKVDRESKIHQDAKVEIKGNEITVSSFDKEAAGQTAANIEKATRINQRDRRVFQDGIYITEKSGKAI